LTGKRWTKEDVKKREEMVAAKKSFSDIAEALGRSEEAVRGKCARLGLDNNNQRKKTDCLSLSEMELPAEIPSVETVLKNSSRKEIAQ
jgi:hypothetical protein